MQTKNSQAAIHLRNTGEQMTAAEIVRFDAYFPVKQAQDCHHRRSLPGQKTDN